MEAAAESAVLGGGDNTEEEDDDDNNNERVSLETSCNVDDIESGSAIRISPPKSKSQEEEEEEEEGLSTLDSPIAAYSGGTATPGFEDQIPVLSYHRCCFVYINVHYYLLYYGGLLRRTCCCCEILLLYFGSIFAVTANIIYLLGYVTMVYPMCYILPFRFGGLIRNIKILIMVSQLQEWILFNY